MRKTEKASQKSTSTQERKREKREEAGGSKGVKFTKKHYRLPRRHEDTKVQINHREHGEQRKEKFRVKKQQ